jgi:hypothetical protein
MQLSCWPVWEFADRNHITNSVLVARWKALVLPAPSRRLLCHTLLRPTAPPTPLARLGLRHDCDRSSVILLFHQQRPDAQRRAIGQAHRFISNRRS